MQHFLLALSLAVTIGVAEARIPYDMGDPSVTIVITQKDGDYPIGNRASSVIPIAGYVDTDAGVVLLNFSQPCGVVHISFENLSDGSNFDTTVNGDGTVIIPVMLSTGTWQLYFTLPNGVRYYGEITL